MIGTPSALTSRDQIKRLLDAVSERTMTVVDAQKHIELWIAVIEQNQISYVVGELERMVQQYKPYAERNKAEIERILSK